MITCPSSLEVRRLDRRADSITAPRYLPSQKLGPELGVKGRRVRTPQGAHPCARSAATVVAGGGHQLITPSPRFNRLLAPCPRRAQTAGDSRSIAGSSGWPRPAQSSGPPRWIARIKLVPKLTAGRPSSAGDEGERVSGATFRTAPRPSTLTRHRT